VGLKYTTTGDTICQRKNQSSSNRCTFPNP
jgi:hypothetical protein